MNTMNQLTEELLWKNRKLDFEDRCLHLSNDLERTGLLITVCRKYIQSLAHLTENKLFPNRVKTVYLINLSQQFGSIIIILQLRQCTTNWKFKRKKKQLYMKTHGGLAKIEWDFSTVFNFPSVWRRYLSRSRGFYTGFSAGTNFTLHISRLPKNFDNTIPLTNNHLYFFQFLATAHTHSFKHSKL